MPGVSAVADPELAGRDLDARRAWLARELELQDGVASRAQLTFGAYTPNDIRRAIRRREMQLVHRGVYVTHTGPLTWRQRAWAAVLYAEPAALCGPSNTRRTASSSSSTAASTTTRGAHGASTQTAISTTGPRRPSHRPPPLAPGHP